MIVTVTRRVSPRRSSTRYGRTLAVEQFGFDSGVPVLFLPASPGSRLFGPDPLATSELGVRLLVVDRPGHSRSSPYPDAAIPGWSAFTDDLAGALEWERLGPLPVIGWSTGGIGALALADRRPDLVTSLGVVASPAPDLAAIEVQFLRGRGESLRRRSAPAPNADWDVCG